MQRPELADYIAQVMTERQTSLDRARNKVNAVALESDTQNLSARIETYFGLKKKARRKVAAPEG